jgi:hypothetical protein
LAVGRSPGCRGAGGAGILIVEKLAASTWKTAWNRAASLLRRSTAGGMLA